ncbi:hypothetical protein OQA88_5342 [Cercophora sp. LCS_1]
MDSPRQAPETTTDPPKSPSPILLLCYIHGFKGTTTTFGTFPNDLEAHLSALLPSTTIKTLIYPQYSTVGELHIATKSFVEWLSAQLTTLTPPDAPRPNVVLIAHSMGGFVASDTLFTTLPSTPVRALLSFDTPYNGLARSMFVYGAFSNYQRVTSVFNVMTALSAAAPAALSKLSTRSVPRATKSSPAWKTWQIIAVRTGTVGAIAAGGVAAYVHRRKIMDGVKGLKDITRDDIKSGMGQGLAYVNRGSVGGALGWLSEHFAFVGSLLRQNEMERRFERLCALRGVGVRDYYVSLGENGVWSGGYFVPERTFCAVPPSTGEEGEKKVVGDKEKEKAADGKGEEKGKEDMEKSVVNKDIFKRCVVEGAEDEVIAHMSIFNKERNQGYDQMVEDAAKWLKRWAESTEEIWDDPKFQEPVPPEEGETEEIAKVVDEDNVEGVEERVKDKGVGEDAVPDESPIDIAAAASLVPLPEDEDGKDDEKKAYLRHLFAIAQSTGSGLWGNIPSKMPTVDMSKVSMPTMPSVSMPSMPAMPSMPSMSMPKSFGLFSRKSDASAETGPSSGPDTGVTPNDKVDGKAAGVGGQIISEKE